MLRGELPPGLVHGDDDAAPIDGGHVGVQRGEDRAAELLALAHRARCALPGEGVTKDLAEELQPGDEPVGPLALGPDRTEGQDANHGPANRQGDRGH